MTIKLPPKTTTLPSVPSESPAADTTKAKPSTAPAVSPHASDTLDSAKTGATNAESKVGNALANPAKAASKTAKAASISAPPGISTDALNDLVGASVKGKRWDVGDPVAASTMLQRFLHSDVNYVENELEALPNLKTMIEQQVRYYEGADATLYDLFQSYPEADLTNAATDFVSGHSPHFEIDGKVVKDPAVLNALKALNLARNPLSDFETKFSDDAFAFAPKSKYTPESVRVATHALETLQDDYLANLGGWESAITKRSERESSPYENLEKTVKETPRGEPLKLAWDHSEDSSLEDTPVSRPLLDALYIIAGRDNPGSLSEADQAVLSALREEFGDALSLNHASLNRAGDLLAPRYDSEQEELETFLTELAAEPDKLACLARQALIDPASAAKQLPGGIDQASALLVLRSIVVKADKPNLVARDSNQPISAYVTEDAVDAGFTFRGLNNVLKKQSELASEQVDIEIQRLAKTYSLDIEPGLELGGTLNAMKRELTDKLSFQMQASAALMRFQNSIGVNTSGPDLRATGPVPQGELDTIAALSGDAMAAAESGDWKSTNQQLEKLFSTLSNLSENYDDAALREVDLTDIAQGLDKVALHARESNEWSTLDIIYSILSLGIFAAYKGITGIGSKDTLTKLDKLTSEINAISGDPDNQITQLIKLQRILENQVIPNLDSAHAEAFMDDFKVILDAAIYNAMKEDTIKSMVEQLKDFEKGGTSTSTSMSIGAGWGVGPAVKIGVDLAVGKSISGSDDRRIREGNSIGLSVGAGGDVGIFKINGKLGGKVVSGTTFKNVEDFVRFHEEDIMLALFRGMPGVSKSFHDRSIARSANQKSAAAQECVDRFNQVAHKFSVLDPNDKVFVPKRIKPKPGRSRTVAGSLSASFKAGLEAAGIGGGVTGVMARTTWFKSINLFDMLKANVGNLNEVIKSDNPLNHSLRDFPEYQTLEDFKAELATLPDRNARAQECIVAIARLSGEFSHYCEMVQGYDNLKRPWSMIYKSPTEARLQNIKHEYQDGRGVKNRAEYVKATLETYALLLETLQEHTSPEELKKIDLSSYDELFESPPIKLNRAQRHQLETQVVKSGTKQNLTFKVNAGLPNGLSTEVAVKIEEIENNSNPDNDGLYLNVSLTAAADLTDLIPSLIEHFQAADPTTLATPQAIAHFAAEGLKTLAKGEASVDGIGLEVGKSVSGTIELNFIKSHNLALQYARLTGSESTSLGVSDIPLGTTGGTMSVGLEKANSVNLAEWIGNSTITYVQTQCNGFKLAGGNWKHDFTMWCLQKENRENIKKLAINMSQPEHNAAKEFADMSEALPADKAHMEGDVRKAMEEMIALKDDAVTDEAINDFISVFSDFIVETSARGGLRKGKIERDGWVFTED